MDLIERKIKALQDVGITTEYQAELMQLINQDKADTLKEFKKDFLDRLQKETTTTGRYSTPEILKALKEE